MSTQEEFEQRIRTQLDVIAEKRQTTTATNYNLLQATGIMGFQLVEQGVRYGFDLLIHSSRVMIPLWQASLRLSLTGFEVLQNNLRETPRQESPEATPDPEAPSAVQGVLSFPTPPGSSARGETSPARSTPAVVPSSAAPPAEPAVPPAPQPAIPPTPTTPPRATPKADIAPLAPEDSFYFQGAEGQYNLPAHTLADFLRGMQEVDDVAWLYHLHRGDYTNWFRYVLHDEELASTASHIAQQQDMPPSESRDQMRAAIQQRYAITL